MKVIQRHLPHDQYLPKLTLARHRYSFGHQFAKIWRRIKILCCHVLLSSILLSNFLFTFFLHYWVFYHLEDLAARVCVTVVLVEWQGFSLSTERSGQALLSGLSLGLFLQQLNVNIHCSNVLLGHFQVLLELFFA